MNTFENRVAPYYHKYINLVQGTDICKELAAGMHETLVFLQAISEKDTLFAYAPGKWTLREILGHLMDAERVFAYRALRIARKDKTPLNGFDENEWVAASSFNETKWSDLLHQYRTLREANLSLFASFNEEDLQQDGIANNSPTNVHAILFIIRGHELHHLQVIRDRYLPALAFAKKKG